MAAIIPYLIIGVLALAGFFGVRQMGYNAAHRECEAAAQQRIIEINNKDKEIGRLQKERDAAISAEQSKQEDIDREVQEKLESELAKRPVADQCRLSDPDARRLR